MLSVIFRKSNQVHPITIDEPTQHILAQQFSLRSFNEFAKNRKSWKESRSLTCWSSTWDSRAELFNSSVPLEQRHRELQLITIGACDQVEWVQNFRE